MSPQVYTVSSLVRYLKQTIDQDMNVQSVLIKGEISNFTNHRSGHWYFTLKDAKAKLSCVMFSSYASRSKIVLKEGMKVIVSASLSVYEAQGSCQLYVTKVQVDGLGDLYLQLEQLKEKLALEGLFDPSHKKQLPSYPEHIIIITAKEGAALQDMLITLKRRWPIARIDFLPSLVQGKDAAASLIKNLQRADTMHADVILLARGGGALEDLWCFNDEALARCIYQMHTVVVSGVGHETDTTLVDYVSDARAATPTAAAELISPDKKEVLQQLMKDRKRMQQVMQQRLQEQTLQLDRMKQHRYLKDPLSYIQEERMQMALHTKELQDIEQRIAKEKHVLTLRSQQLAMYFSAIEKHAQEQLTQGTQALLLYMRQYQEHRKQDIVQKSSLLDAYSPLKILSRGYGVIYQQEHIIKSMKDIEKEEIDIRMQDGIVHALVTHKEEF